MDLFYHFAAPDEILLG